MRHPFMGVLVLLDALPVAATLVGRRDAPQRFAVILRRWRWCKPSAVATCGPPLDRTPLPVIGPDPSPARLEPMDAAFTPHDAWSIALCCGGAGPAAVDRIDQRPEHQLERFRPRRRSMAPACPVRRSIDARRAVLRKRRTHPAHACDTSRARSGSFWRCVFCVAGVLAAAGVRVRAASRAACVGRGAGAAGTGGAVV